MATFSENRRLVLLSSYLNLLKFLDKLVDKKGSWKVVDVIASRYLSQGLTLWAGDGCVLAA
jgi:3-methyladenine DNA glycosylase AlkD